MSRERGLSDVLDADHLCRPGTIDRHEAAEFGGRAADRGHAEGVEAGTDLAFSQGGGGGAGDKSVLVGSALKPWVFFNP
ncbi:MAG: hypothetical protein JWP04_2736 [Belnapia sp.]|nr:hypothetical protein [Belnapia sp.]